MSTHREYHDVWGLHGVICWQNDATMIDSAFELRVAGTADSKVPLEQVVAERLSKVVGRRLLQLHSLAHQPLYGYNKGMKDCMIRFCRNKWNT